MYTKHKWENDRHFNFNYVKYLPKDYDENKKYPLVFFLHGAGEWGDNLEDVCRHGFLKRVRENGKEYPFICIAGNVAHNLRMLYILYPASWSVCLVAAIIIYIVLFNKVKRKFDLEKAENNRLEQTKENQTA